MSDTNPPKLGGLWARLFGVGQSESAENQPQTPENSGGADPNDASTNENEIPDPAQQDASTPSSVFLTDPDVASPTKEDVETPSDSGEEQKPDGPPLASPVESPDIAPAPLAKPVDSSEEPPSPTETEDIPSPPLASPVDPDVADKSETDVAAVAAENETPAESIVEPDLTNQDSAAEDDDTTATLETPVTPQECPACGAQRQGASEYCADCGYLYPPTAVPVANQVSGMETSSNGMGPQVGTRINDRYEIREQIGERAGVTRHRGFDHGDGSCPPKPVMIVCGPVPEEDEPESEPVAEVPDMELDEEDLDIMPTFDDAVPVAEFAEGPVQWPSPQWERAVLETAVHPALPSVVDFVEQDGFEYLIEEAPQGVSLWDAWDDPESNAFIRYGHLVQIAESLHALHQTNAMIEGINPNMIVVTEDGQAMLADLSDLLPVPLPENPTIRATLYTAPELIVSPHEADARSELYSFGAMIYSLEYLHHPLEEKDFEHQYSPNLITDRYPDVHPTFFRLICKTFVRDLNTRFPTDEAAREDPTGFTELIRTLESCRRNLDKIRLDIAAWTTTGMVRTGNEDAFAFLHAAEQRQDDVYEYALFFLADGMGGYEAGEVAAAMAIAELRSYLLQQPMFAALAGKETPPEGSFDLEECKKIFIDALRHANKEVYNASKDPSRGRRGMGCTAEVVYVDANHIVAGHVGDSRVYHVHYGRLKQMTTDQTLVNRLVELGQLTEEEAESHPRKNELQQAIGGQPDVGPTAYSAQIHRGDWILVCSDGLSNHIPNRDLEQMLTRETAGSSEEAARRLLNLVNLRGATDNSTIVVARAT